MNDKQLDRLSKVNKLIELIANTDRCFFNSKNGIGKFVPLERTIHWHDGYTQRTMPIIRDKRMEYFSNGGTMKAIVLHLKQFILKGSKLTYGGLYNANWGYSIEGQNKIAEFGKEIGYINPDVSYKQYLIDAYNETDWQLHDYMRKEIETQLLNVEK
jgi:hypothetical protein